MRVDVLKQKYGDVPFSRHLMLEVLREYKSPNDKISELLAGGELTAIRRGLYISGVNGNYPTPEPFLIANHLRGPSYVSLEAALSYWGLIPERVYEISSATLKTSKKYTTPVGRFSFYHVPSPYYAFGIRSVQLTAKQTVLIASPEKALCDKIILTSAINLRSVKQTREFLLEDLRIDEEQLQTLDSEIIHSWLENAPKKTSLKMLIKTLQELC